MVIRHPPLYCAWAEDDEARVFVRAEYVATPPSSAYITDQGIRFDAGCQRQITRKVFEQRLADTHDENEHAKEYSATLALVDTHAEIWTPKKVA